MTMTRAAGAPRLRQGICRAKRDAMIPWDAKAMTKTRGRRRVRDANGRVEQRMRCVEESTGATRTVGAQDVAPW